MDQTLNALGGLILKALPTLLLVLLLHFYLRAMFYGPLDKVLHERKAATEGTRKLADESLANAERKTRDYEEQLRAARGEIYREQEEMRGAWRHQQSGAIEEARRNAGAMVVEARERIQDETEIARRALEAEAEALAEQIAGSVLRGSAA